GDQDRRRIAPHALHGAEQDGDLAMPRREMAADLVLLLGQDGLLALDLGKPRLAVMDDASGLTKAVAQALTLGLYLGDALLEAFCALVGLVEFLARLLEALAGLTGCLLRKRR